MRRLFAWVVGLVDCRCRSMWRVFRGRIASATDVGASVAVPSDDGFDGDVVWNWSCGERSVVLVSTDSEAVLAR